MDTIKPPETTIPFWKSKSVYVAILGAILGAIAPVSAAAGHPIVVPNWVYEILASYGVYCLRDGMGKPLA